MATYKLARGTIERKNGRTGTSTSTKNSSTTTTAARTTTTTATATTTTTRTTPEEVVLSTTHGRNSSEINMEIEDLRELYYDVFDRPMPRVILRQVEQTVKEDDDDTAYWYYRYAMMQTSYAPRPSWQYTMAIMARLHREHVPVDHIMFN